MAQPTNEPDVTILPEPDLNPLMNPLLAKHMGRWAEVYFTTPPEKRAEAVSELVRELTRNSPAVDVADLPTPANENHHDENHNEDPREDFPDQPVIAKPFAQETATLICESCGAGNSALQRFCGMCGLPLTFSEESDSQEIAEAAPVSARVWDGPERSSLNRVETVATDSTAGFYAHDEDIAPRESSPVSPTGWRPNEFHSLTQYEPEPSRRNYKVYVGLAVAVVLASLVYVTWRSNTTFWRSGTAPAALPQAVPAPSGEAQTAPPAKPADTATTQPTPANNAHLARPTPASLSQNQKQTSLSAENDQRSKARSAPAAVPASVNSSATAPEQSGAEELAMAEKYLNAGPGAARDSQQAVAWLWKAVAKQNLTATMLLSDLYLRGDGVAKSCDQARLLLDVAARKGRAAAAERLRNMPAFGCQ
ncbi:MAG: hypothetical protein WB919_16625 [Candidatus Sulfotelmatobacter sp.]